MAPPGQFDRGRFEAVPGQGELFPENWQSDDQIDGQLELDLGMGTGPVTRPADSSMDIIDAFDDYEDPTTTTNPGRPRTLLAGYRAAEQTMYVMFRDGTLWEYRGVPQLLWSNFKRAYSKGWFLHKSGLDAWGDMGPASLSGLPTADRQVFMTRAQIAQTRIGGVGFGKSPQYMERLRRQDARIKAKGIMTPARDRISNPYIEQGRKRPKI